MLKKSTRTFTMALAATAVIATATTGFAGPTSQPDTERSSMTYENKRVSQLEALVNDGTIDPATYDAIQAYQDSNRPDNDGTLRTRMQLDGQEDRKDILSDMLSANVITQSEYDAIKGAMPTGRLNIMEQFLSDGVIDQSTYDAIQAYQEANKPDRTAIKDKTEGSMERGEKPERIDMLSSLLDNGVITQAQYDAMKASMPTPSEPFDAQDGKNKMEIGNPFEALVTNGTISQSTYDAMKAYMESNMPAIGEGERVFKDSFSEMLENGIITQSQYDAIKDAMPSRPDNFERPSGTERIGKPQTSGQ